jgi:hypothetical protein
LVIKGANESYDPVVSISRYALGTNEEEWIEEMSQRSKIDNRTIKFDPYPDIGNFLGGRVLWVKWRDWSIRCLQLSGCPHFHHQFCLALWVDSFLKDFNLSNL